MKNMHFGNTYRWINFILILVLCTSTVTVPTMAQNEDVTITGLLVTGEQVTLSTSGFQPSERIDFTWTIDGQEVIRDTQRSADSAGNFVVENLALQRAGSNTFTFRGQSSDIVKSTEVQVLNPCTIELEGSWEATPVPPGQLITGTAHVNDLVGEPAVTGSLFLFSDGFGQINPSTTSINGTQLVDFTISSPQSGEHLFAAQMANQIGIVICEASAVIVVEESEPELDQKIYLPMVAR